MSKSTASLTVATPVETSTPAAKPANPVLSTVRALAAMPPHSQTAERNRTPAARASRIAQAVNATHGHSSNGGGYWTGVDVLSLMAREGVTLA
jgi:hypothetical protein